MSLSLEDVKGSQYSLEQIEAGLTAMAIWHGNSRQASRVLGEAGIEVPPTTLILWKNTHTERYAELTEQIVPQVREKLAQQFEVIGMRSAELTLDTLEQFSDEVKNLPARDLAGAIRNLSTAGAIGVDKASLLRGMPTEIRKTENVSDLVERVQQTEKALREKYPSLFVESTAEEIPDAEVVESEPEGRAERQLPRAPLSVNAQD